MHQVLGPIGHLRPFYVAMKPIAEAAKIQLIAPRQMGEGFFRKQTNMAISWGGIPPIDAVVGGDLPIRHQGRKQYQPRRIHNFRQIPHELMHIGHVLKYFKGGDEVKSSQFFNGLLGLGKRIIGGGVVSPAFENSTELAVAPTVIQMAD